MARSTSEVFEDHLRLRAAGALEQDLARNYSEGVVLIHEFGVMHGLDGARKSGLHLQLRSVALPLGRPAPDVRRAAASYYCSRLSFAWVRNAEGGLPVHFLNARWKLPASLKPVSAAMSSSRRPEVIRYSVAIFSRTRSRISW